MGNDLSGKAVASETGRSGFGHDSPNIKPIPTTRLRRRQPGGSSLRLVMGANRVRCGKPLGICLPTAADSSPMFDPLP